jgi:hypothetical protein
LSLSTSRIKPNDVTASVIISVITPGFFFVGYTLFFVSRDSAVGIATSYWLDDRGVGVRVPRGSRIFTSPCRPDRLWVPPNLLSNGYRRIFPQGYSCRVVKLTTHVQLVSRSNRGSVHPLPYTTSWRSAYLVKYRDSFIFTLPSILHKSLWGTFFLRVFSTSIYCCFFNIIKFEMPFIPLSDLIVICCTPRIRYTCLW